MCGLSERDVEICAMTIVSAGSDDRVIVDIHTHTPTQRDPIPTDRVVKSSIRRPDRIVIETTSWVDYERDMAPVDVSIVFNLAVASPDDDVGVARDRSSVNVSTAEFVASNATHRIGFMSVNPRDPGALEEIETCRFDLGLAGIKL